MPVRFEVSLKPEIKDPLGEKIKKRIEEDLKIKHISSVRTIEVYTIQQDLPAYQLVKIREELLKDPVIQEASFNSPLATNFDWLIEVGFKPGVTDNVGKTMAEAVEDILKVKTTCFSSRQFLFQGKLTEEEVKKIGTGILANDLIETWQFVPASSFDPQKGMPINLPLVVASSETRIEEINLNVSDEELMEISRKRVLALSLAEMKQIRAYFKEEKIKKEREKYGLGEKILDAELELLAQTWSEHCKHKIFNSLITYREGKKIVQIDSLFNTYIKKSTDEIGKEVDWLVSVFHDNAGVIRFNRDWNLVFKVETHNAPSALDPYGGALTGIVGVNRDSFGTGKGARLIFNVDTFCFADPFYEKEVPPRLFHPKRVFEGVRLGVEHGGNKSGIPTVNGSIVFDERYLGKPLVYCGTGAIMPAQINGKPSEEKTALPGDLIMMVGGRIGKDGIHGATFSSEELHQDSPISAVQIGDPITQKKMFDFLLEARDRELYRCITDNGAGGLASSVGEMAQFSGGCEIQLERCPLKYSGLAPWEILLSEAQERMTLAVPPEKETEFLSLAQRRNVEATVIGKFTNSGKFVAKYKDRIAALVDMDFLHHGVPKMKLEAEWKRPTYTEPDPPRLSNLTPLLKAMLSRLNVCSKEAVIRQYDHEVQGTVMVKPLCGINNDGPSDAAVIQPLYSSVEGVVVSSGICPKYSDIDTYWMMACAIDEAIRNNVAVGGNPARIALLDNFCWPDPIVSDKNPDGKYKLAQLVRANQALYHYARAFKTPFISGKDSMKNDYQIGKIKISVPPTVLISALGKIEDVNLAVTMDVKEKGDWVYILGMTYPELGGSEYFHHLGYIGNRVPRVKAKEAKKLYHSLHQAMKQKLVASCHDLSDGGLGVALAEISFAGGWGLEINLSQVPQTEISREDYLLFSETPSRFLVTVKPQLAPEFENLMQDNVLAKIGKVIGEKELIIKGFSGEVLVKAEIDELKEAWQKPLRW